MSEVLECIRDENVIIATMRRPEAMNALSTPLCEALDALAAECDADHGLRCLILTAEGRAFCAGADLKERARLDEEARWRYVENLNRTIRRLEEIPIPVIAAVNGFALGGGLEVALACDLRLAAASARFGLPEARWGIMAGGSLVRVLRDLRPGVAAMLAYSAEHFTADQARQWGLIDDVLPDDRLISGAVELASQIAKNAPLGLRAAKQLQRGLQRRYTEEGMVLAEKFRRPLDDTEDCLEGLRAFAEKREPDFKGR